MNPEHRRLTTKFFLVGAIVGAILIPIVSAWLAASAPVGVRHEPMQWSQWAWLGLRGAVAMGLILGSIPLVFSFTSRAREATVSRRDLIYPLVTALAVFAAAIFYMRSVVAGISEQELQAFHVVIHPAALSIVGPSLLAIGSVVALGIITRRSA